MNSYRLHREYVGREESLLEPPIEFKSRNQAKKEVAISKLTKRIGDTISHDNKTSDHRNTTPSTRQIEQASLDDSIALALNEEDWIEQEQVRLYSQQSESGKCKSKTIILFSQAGCKFKVNIETGEIIAITESSLKDEEDECALGTGSLAYRDEDMKEFFTLLDQQSKAE